MVRRLGAMSDIHRHLQATVDEAALTVLSAILDRMLQTL